MLDKYFEYGTETELTRNEYLYGSKFMLFKIPKFIITYNLYKLNNNLEEMLKPHYLHRDDIRVRDIQDEIKFWLNIKETNYERKISFRRRIKRFIRWFKN